MNDHFVIVIPNLDRVIPLVIYDQVMTLVSQHWLLPSLSVNSMGISCEKVKQFLRGFGALSFFHHNLKTLKTVLTQHLA